MGFTEYTESMISTMEDAVYYAIRLQMNMGWSFSQIEPLFDTAVKRAKEEIKKQEGFNA